MIRPPVRPFSLLLLCVLALAGPASAQRGAIAAQRNLAELTERAETIVRGHVASAEVAPHPQFANLTTVLVTLNVSETLKGKAARQLTFRQYVWDVRDQYDAARYRKGDEYLLLLNPVSPFGLTSPAGMEQGRFRVLRRRPGKTLAVNGARNAGLFRGVPEAAARKQIRLSARAAVLAQEGPAGPVALDDLEQVIRSFVQGAR